MAISSGTYWQINGGATAGNVNGGGFNTTNANFITDFTTDSNTANTASPVLSSASYNFVAGDVGAWVFVQSGTNWYPNTFYQIASVASNKATLSAAIGQGLTINANTNQLVSNTAVGVASVGTPTGGVCGIDYSQGTSSITNNTDLASSNGTTNPSAVTSAGSPFGLNHVGNILHVTAGTNWTQNWYEIVSVSGVTATLDRAVGTSASISSGTFRVGGALSMNSTLDDEFFEVPVGRNNIYFNTNFSLGEAVSVASTSATGTNAISMKGYQNYRYDNPTGDNRPLISGTSFSLALGQYKVLSNFRITGTANPVLNTSTGGVMINLKVTNTTVGSGSVAITNSTNGLVFNCEAVSQNGVAVNLSTSSRLIASYIHDSDIGVQTAASGAQVIFNVFEACRSYGFRNTSTGNEQFSTVLSNTFYGREAKIGTGIEFAVATTHPSNMLFNNIFYGLTNGIVQLTAQKLSNIGDYNDFFNNTTNLTLSTPGLHDLAIDPSFGNAAQITGTTATTNGSVLTQSGGDFSSVQDNVDYLHVLSGTSVTTGGYLITSHTATTLTVNNTLGTSIAGNVVYFITTGHNFAVGPALSASGFPGTFQAGETSAYLNVGAAQRSGSGGGSYVFGG